MLADAVKRGVVEAGGLPLEFPTMSLGENWMKPTAMLFRNLMAMDVEETIRANPLDAVVLLGGCDKTLPALVMGAASVDVPAIVLPGGPAKARLHDERLTGTGTDLWKRTAELRAGRLGEDEWRSLATGSATSPGHCTEMGTASTMSALIETLGLTLPGAAAVPAMASERIALAEATGRRAVALAVSGPRPSEILTAAAFDNAIRTLVALGGSTNAVVHLLAIAGRVGVDLCLRRFGEIAVQVPLLANVQPSGAHLFEALHRAGGVPALLSELLPLLDGDAITVTGRPLTENVSRARGPDTSVITTLAAPLGPPGGLAILSGSLAPRGAVLKRSAGSPELMRHRGRAVVFDGIDDVARRIDDPGLGATADSVLVLRGAGPVGGPGMPEWGMLPIPEPLLRSGVDDVVRISDARMSGSGYGTVVLHVTPEAAVGGPLALVRNGDPIVLDADEGRLELDVPASTLARRAAALTPPERPYSRGYGALYVEHVLQADLGCDFDFLRALPAEPPESEPLGFVDGWIGGW